MVDIKGENYYERKKNLYAKKYKNNLKNCLCQIPDAKINLHNEKSWKRGTIFFTIILHFDKALKIFGDCEVMYPQLSKYEDFEIPCIEFGVVIED